MLTKTEWSPRISLKTIVTVRKLRLAQMRLRTRFLLTIKLSSMLQLRKLSAGWTPILQVKKKSTKRSRKHSKVLQHQFFKQWQVPVECQVQVECQVVCQVVCLTWAVCQIWVVHLQLLIQQAVQLSRRSTKEGDFTE